MTNSSTTPANAADKTFQLMHSVRSLFSPPEKTQESENFRASSTDLSAEARRSTQMLESDIQGAAKICSDIIDCVEGVVLGKTLQVKQALTCVLARGHLLIEDVPGVGKTTLANALATALGLQFNRVQFTSDLMPADVIGGSVYDRKTQRFIFHPGPVFSQVLLADEINRASPKTQSALLEAMAEGQVSLEGETRLLPHPFFVLATQNPTHQMGTFPLPESQMDRFLMSISMGYPDESAEKRMLMTGQYRTKTAVKAAVCAQQVIALQDLVQRVVVAPAVADYAWRVVNASRTSSNFVDGLSPRAGMSWMRAAQSWALVNARGWVIPDDLQATFVQCALHRLQTKTSRHLSRQSASASLLLWLKEIDVESRAV